MRRNSFPIGGKHVLAVVAAITLLVIAWLMRVEPEANASFPDGTFDSDKAAWYSAALTAIQEPPLFALNDEAGASYRFTNFPALMRPVSVRIESQADGGATLTYTVGDFAGEGGIPKGVVDRKQRPLSAAEYSKFVTKFAALNICDLPASEPDEQMILDGEIWMFEYRSGDEYCVIERLGSGSDPYVSTAQYMLGLAGYFRSD